LRLSGRCCAKRSTIASANTSSASTSSADKLFDRAQEHLEELSLVVVVASGDHRRGLRPKPNARALASAISIPNAGYRRNASTPASASARGSVGP
jgi:hypothetical protein